MSSVASDLRLGSGFSAVFPGSIRRIQLERQRADCERRVQGKGKLRMCSAKVERLQAEQGSSKPSEQATTRVKFVLHKECLFGEYFKVTGSDQALGGWDPSAAVALKWSENHVWTAELELAEGGDYEYKFLLSRINGEDVWQPGPNRQFATGNGSGSLTIMDCWDFNQSSVCETVDGVVVDAVAGEALYATTVEEAIQDESQCALEDEEWLQPLDSEQDVQEEPGDPSEEATEANLVVQNEVLIDGKEVLVAGVSVSDADEAVLEQDVEQLSSIKNEKAATKRRTSSDCIFQSDFAWILKQVSRFFNRFR